MEIIDADVTKVNGFTALGKNVGIKNGKPDFAVIYSDTVCTAAATYTKNLVKGAPLVITKEHLADGKLQAIVINSGVANVCTGEKGLADAKEMAALAAKELGISEKNVAVASTGVIGKYLPMEKIRAGMKGIKSELSTDSNVAQAIMTTDLVQKQICVKEANFTIGAIAKGSGMIHPNMATMLAFICTDAQLESAKLDAMLKKIVSDSFNMMTVDMDTSTSDMCIVLANGKAGKVDEAKFEAALGFVCKELARKIAADGEGATKLLEVTVKGASDAQTAKILAKSIVSSNLVKCAAYGNDPNWGRILCAMGNSGAQFDAQKVDVWFGDDKNGKDGQIKIVENGVTTDFDYTKVKAVMAKTSLPITIDLHSGSAQATAFGCDMTEQYIEINAHYTT